ERVRVVRVPVVVVGRKTDEFVGTCGTRDIDIDLVTDPRIGCFGERAVEDDLVDGSGFDTLLYSHRGELGTGPGVAELGHLFLIEDRFSRSIQGRGREGQLRDRPGDPW